MADESMIKTARGMLEAIPAKNRRLPKKFKQDWLAALRSGEYKQGKFSLLDENGGYCCMGVACAMRGVPQELMALTDIPHDLANATLEQHRIPQVLLSEWQESGTLPTVLSKLNDELCLSFDEIADLVERHC